jgi:hypothetical protein
MYLNNPVTKEVPYWLIRENHLRNTLFEKRHNIFTMTEYSLAEI